MNVADQAQKNLAAQIEKLGSESVDPAAASPKSLLSEGFDDCFLSMGIHGLSVFFGGLATKDDNAWEMGKPFTNLYLLSQWLSTHMLVCRRCS